MVHIELHYAAQWGPLTTIDDVLLIAMCYCAATTDMAYCIG